jgi:hypothetical protein
MSDTATILLSFLLLASLAFANVAFAKRRAARYFLGAGLRIVDLKTSWLNVRTGPFGRRDGRIIFCAHLEDQKGLAIPAWIAAAGFIPFYVGESLEIKFSPTGAFPRHPAL